MLDNVAFIGLGGNLGDRLQALTGAAERIAQLPNTEIAAVSQAYETEPWGVVDQPPFANAVVRVHTQLTAMQLLGYLLDIETDMGRPPADRRAAAAKEPRIIDLDLLLFDGEEWHTADLTLPHPRMREREFVMHPLTEIGPDARWPDGTALTEDEARSATGGKIVRALGPIPGSEGITVTSAHGGWVELATLSRFRMERKPDFDLIFAETVLRDHGIPYAWDPHPPGEGFNPWGLSSPVRLLVPSAYAETASRLMAEAAVAPVDWRDADPAG